MTQKIQKPEEKKSTPLFFMLPAIFFTAVIILLIRIHIYVNEMEEFTWNYQGSTMIDLYAWIKMTAILGCAVAAFVLLIYQIWKNTLEWKKSRFYIPILIYSAAVLLSYLFSPYKKYALFGVNERFEGTLVLLSYMFMLVYIMLVIKSERNVKQVLYTTTGISAILGIVGIFQMAGINLFFTSAGQYLITPKEYRGMLTLTNTLGNMISQTLYNPNYVSFYLTLLVPVAGMLFFFYTKKRSKNSLWKAVVWLMFFCLLVLNMAGSLSSSGFIGLAVEVLVAVLFLNRKLRMWWKQILTIVILSIVICLLVPGFRSEILKTLNYVNSSVTEEAQTSEEQAPEEQTIEEGKAAEAIVLETVTSLDTMWTSTDGIHMSINGNPFMIEVKRDAKDGLEGIELTDAEGAALFLEQTADGSYYTTDERFSHFMFLSYGTDNDQNYVDVQMSDMLWRFIVTENAVRYRDPGGNLVELEQTAYFDFADQFSFAEKRGYVWSRTVPLLKDVLLIGHGADTFSIYFPQNDFAGKYTSQIGVTTLVDKPHNMYLGIMMGTGGISLLALLCFFGMYLVQSVRALKKTKMDTFLEYAGAGIFLGVCGFLTAGFANDTNVCVMPLFYGLMATGIAINQLIIRDTAADKNEQTEPRTANIDTI